MEAFYTEFTGFVNQTAATTAGKYNYTIEIGVNVNAPVGTLITYVAQGPPDYGMTSWLIALSVITVVIVLAVVVVCIVKVKKNHETLEQETTEPLTTEAEELSRSIQGGAED